jgi:hypothetical protein
LKRARQAVDASCAVIVRYALYRLRIAIAGLLRGILGKAG